MYVSVFMHSVVASSNGSLCGLSSAAFRWDKGVVLRVGVVHGLLPLELLCRCKVMWFWWVRLKSKENMFLTLFLVCSGCSYWCKDLIATHLRNTDVDPPCLHCWQVCSGCSYWFKMKTRCWWWLFITWHRFKGCVGKTRLRVRHVL